MGYRPQSVVVRGSGSNFSGYNYLRGTCNNGTTNTNTSCLSPKVDGNGSANHRYRLTIDSRTSGRAIVKVERDTGSGFISLIDSFDALDPALGQSPLPQDFYVSLTGSTGALTNIHELDNVEICALKSRDVGVQVDHFELQYSSQPLTCNPEEITIKACANPDCSLLITDPVSVSLLPQSLPDGGWYPLPGASNVSGNVVTFSGGSGKILLRNNTQTPITLGVQKSVPTAKPLSITLCKVGNGSPTPQACTFSFADSGFFFDVPDTYSNQPQTVTIKAVKKSDVTKQCVPGFASQTKSIKFWSSYITPANNAYNSQMSVNGSTIGASQGAATPLSLAFDAQGQSSITVAYPDAGQVQLDARYDGSGNEAGLIMTGADQFVARPVGLCITSSSGSCSGNYASCPVFRKTGATFPIQIQAMAWESGSDNDLCTGNQATPNFVLNGIALGTTLVAPTPGTNATVGTATYNHAAATNSINTVNQTVNEVGVFNMTATPPANGYFGYTIPSAQSAPLGRFVPTDFNLVSGDIMPACNVFSYMGQPFGVTLDVRARNQSGGQTQNYTGAFAKGSAYISVANNKDGKSLASRLTSLASLPWANGKAVLNNGTTSLARLSDTQPDGPYKSLLFGLYMNDNDGGNTLIATPDFNDAVVGNCSGAACNARLIDSVPMQAYFGRLFAGTQAGLASADLAVPLQLQYYEAGNWVLNKLDQCTPLSLAGQGIAFLNPSHSFDAATSSLNLGTGRTIKLGLGSTPPGAMSGTAKDGEILFQFAKPGIAVRIPYKVDLAKQPSSPLWLSDPLTQQGEAIFGSTRGNDRIIYRREILR